MSEASKHPEVPQHAAADLATGGTKQPAPRESLAKQPEAFNDVDPWRDEDNNVVFEIENTPGYEKHFGLLWTGGTWLTVAQAREFRDWLDKVIP